MKKIILTFLFTLLFSPAVFCASPKLTLFTEPNDGKQILLDALSNAQKSIDLEIHQMSDPDLISALESQASKVTIRVILQQNLWPNLSKNKFSALDPQQLKTELESHGILVHWGNSKFAYTHEKCLVIDNQTAYIMTSNWSSSAFKTNREYGIADTYSKDVNEIESVFNADWNLKSPPTLSDAHLLWSPNNAREKITDLMNAATKTLYLEGEVFEDDQIQDTLVALAKKSLDIRLIVGYPDNGQQKAELQTLINNGIQVRILDSTQNPPLGNLYMHAKMFLVDDAVAYVGSINYLTQSLDQNRELGIQISDPTIIVSLFSTFQDDWNHAVPFSNI